MRQARRLGRRGFLLLSSYFLLSLFLIYSGAMTVRTTTQRMVSDQLHDRFQAADLAQGAMEQLRDDFFRFLSANVYQVRWQGDAVQALHWVDGLNPASNIVLDPPFALPVLTGMAEGGLPLSEAAPRRIILPVGLGEAWIAGVGSTNPGSALAARLVTLEAKATVGGITKRLRATYEIALGMSDVFRYGYFLNNYGWFDVQGASSITVNGEVRSNGDLKFSGHLNSLHINGDLYASSNPALLDPVTGQPALGTITGNPTAEQTWGNGYSANEYWLGARRENPQARPPRELSSPFEPPPIGGTPKILDEGYGWDGVQSRFAGVDPQPIPYLGDLSLYKQSAQAQGATLTYTDPGTDGVYATNDDIRKTIVGVYHGPDGVEGTSDDDEPLVLVTTIWWQPIVITGPIVVPGDVIIKGQVSGQGTIYAGRNVHIVGDITYVKPTYYPNLARDRVSGKIVDWNGVTNSADTGGHSYSHLGWVCNGGTYVNPDDPAGANPSGPCH